MNGRERIARRLKGYDYGQAGAYFVTLCAHARKPRFGEVQHGVMVHSAIGEAVESCWKALPLRFSHVEVDDFVVMPNHVHGIVLLTETGRSTSPLSVAVRSFKEASTKAIRALSLCRTEPVWQRNFYDHIVRDEADLSRIRSYIRNNPANWSSDTFHR